MGFFSWMLNPFMLGLGGLAILSPIIIHLLNRRRFKIVDWAAMDFLLDANRKNRRRVKLENLLLLLLRCLAMLLIGLLLARPFLTKSLIVGETAIERIILLDDSLSTGLRRGDKGSTGKATVFDNAKEKLESMIHEIAGGEGGGVVTLFLTSQPDAPLFASKPVNSETQSEFSETLKELQPSDKAAAVDLALQGVASYIGQLNKNVDPLVYVISDMRERDWKEKAKEGEDKNSARSIIKSISEQVKGCYLVDAGIPEYANLVIKSVRPAEGLRAGVGTSFTVVVANQGGQTAENVRVSFRKITGSGEDEAFGVASYEVIDSLPAGEQRPVAFQFLVPLEEFLDDESETAAEAMSQTRSVRVVAAIEPEIEQGGLYDRLEADSTSYFAARVIKGNPVLLVDGDMQSKAADSETDALREALAPEGYPGNLVDVISKSELSTHSISPYRVIFICNVDAIPEDKVAELEKWVANGGGLVIMPGDQVIAEDFNSNFYKEGSGVSPVRLTETYGDLDKKRFGHFSIPKITHQIVDIFSGQSNILVGEIKIFSWWGSVIDPEQEGKTITRIASLTDALESPAIVEKSFGKGRVVYYAIPADFAWSNWPDMASYLVSMHQLVDYLCDDRSTAGELQVGGEVQVPVDLATYDKDAKIGFFSLSEGEDKDEFSVQAKKPEDGNEKSSVWGITFDDVARKGFYELQLSGVNDKQTNLLFAANVDPREGDLKPLDFNVLGADYFGPKITRVGVDEMSRQTTTASNNEIWRFLLYLLGAVLGIELLMGWVFGKRR